MFDFEMLDLPAHLKTRLKELNFSEPTPIQNKAIPLALAGHDILGLAQTGTGKTLAFGLPLLNHVLNAPGKPEPKVAKSLILAPTRELVNQIAESLKQFTIGTKVRVMTVVGGQSINEPRAERTWQTRTQSGEIADFGPHPRIGEPNRRKPKTVYNWHQSTGYDRCWWAIN